MTKYSLFLSVLILALTACGEGIDIDEKINHQTDSQKDFEKEFIAKYGTVSPDISWMTVSSAPLRIDLSALRNEKMSKIQVFTANPCANLDYCYLLAEYSDVKDGMEIQFDYPTGLKSVYVTVAASTGNTYTNRVDTNNSGKQAISFSSDPDTSFAEGLPMRYLMCFEGFTADKPLDFDYNDLIAEIEYVRGCKNMKVRAVAAGCTCAVQLVYRRNGNPEKGTDEILLDEVHKEMGLDGRFDYMENRVLYLMLNTGINRSKYIPDIDIMLEEDVNASITAIAPRLYAKFTITAKKQKDETTTTAFLPIKKGANYPQAILIAYPDFEWAREAMLMSAAYSEFRPWIHDPELYPFWYGGDNWKKANEYVEN